MVRHLFKLIWNRKRRTLLLTIEILVSFLVLFAILSIFTSNYANYLQPIGFEYKNTWNVRFAYPESKDTTALIGNYEKVWESLKAYPEIESYSFMNYGPYYRGMTSTSFTNAADRNVRTFLINTTDKGAEVLGLKLIEGRWFNENDDAANKTPVVITRTIRDNYFGIGDGALGKTIVNKHGEGAKKELFVVGVVEDYKYMGEFSEPKGSTFFRLDKNNLLKKGVSILWISNIVLKIRPGTGVEFEETLIKHIKDITGNWTANVSYSEVLRDKHIKSKVVSLVIPGAIAIFLILNVALGLLGILWYSINRRRGEIGLRRAVGGSGKDIAKQIVGESLVLGTFSILIGLLFAVQFPVLKVFRIENIFYAIALVLAALFLYILIIICSLYPSILASKVEPAEALHND